MENQHDMVDNYPFLFSRDGRMNMWRQLDGAWYYFNSDGRMATGMIEVGGLRYYMDPSDGRMVSGRAVEINGVTYQAAADGHLSQQGQETTGDQSSQNSGNNASGSNTGKTR